MKRALALVPLLAAVIVHVAYSVVHDVALLLGASLFAVACIVVGRAERVNGCLTPEVSDTPSARGRR